MKLLSNYFIFIKFISLIILTVMIIRLNNSVFNLMIIICTGFISMTLLKRNVFIKRLQLLIITSFSIFIFYILFIFNLDFYQKMQLAFSSSLRIFSLSLLVFIFADNTSVFELLKLFFFLPSTLKTYIVITFSLIRHIQLEYFKITIVQTSRGINLKGLNLFKSLPPIIIPLTRRTSQKAERIALILESRGIQI